MTSERSRGSGSDLRLEMHGIRKSFGSVDALRGVDLEVRPGEIMALVGDNGAGKSTLVKTLSGAQPADAGTIRVDGEPVSITSPQDAVRAGIETVYQDLALCDNLDVVANLYLGRELRSPRQGLFGRFLARGRMSHHARQVLDELAVTLPALSTPVAALSGGQRQAIAVGRAVLWGSKVVVLDEPTAALGVQQTATVYRLIRTLSERGVSVVLISHNMVDVFELADRITVLRLGEGAGVFTPAESTPQDVIAAITGGNVVPLGGKRA
ncbi:ATP-binding cassette domain-containing protein [Dactylosporangium sp. NPDC000244]|uniref:ATP-binding cassette domain-containing protein n=1 Tax=Dactylosporangium sp. NPDC000244 TaxID=3154365 RepID=UPI003332FAA9